MAKAFWKTLKVGTIFLATFFGSWFILETIPPSLSWLDILCSLFLAFIASMIYTQSLKQKQYESTLTDWFTELDGVIFHLQAYKVNDTYWYIPSANRYLTESVLYETKLDAVDGTLKKIEEQKKILYAKKRNLLLLRDEFVKEEEYLSNLK